MLDQINQLAKEFGLTDLEKYIMQQKSKWEEYELYIENEMDKKNQEIHHLQENVALLHQTTQDQSNEINSLKKQLEEERINNQNNIAQLNETLAHIKEELMSNINQQIDEEYISKKNLRSAVAASKSWSEARKNCPYHLAYQAILYTFSKFEEEI